MCRNKDKPNICVINGPNINILGVREPHVYGHKNWGDIEKKLQSLADELIIDIEFYQSNHDGYIVDFIQKNLDRFDGIIINPAAYTKTGYAILDALTSVSIPYIEVHISNIFSRGEWHAESIFSKYAIGQIIGFKGYSYELALRAIVDSIEFNKSN